MSINHPQRATQELQEMYVALEPLDIEYPASCIRFTNKRALALLQCCLCSEYATIGMHKLYSTTGALIPGPRDNRYTFKCASCNPTGLPSLVHLPKSWTQALSTAIYNMTHQIGIGECLSVVPAGEGRGSLGWYPFFDISTEICPFINHFWDQLAPLNTSAHHYWAPKVIATLTKHHDIFVPSKRVYQCKKTLLARKWGILYTHLGKAKYPKLEKVVGQRIQNGVIENLVKWRGYTRFAWETEDCVLIENHLDQEIKEEKGQDEACVPLNGISDTAESPIDASEKVSCEGVLAEDNTKITSGQEVHTPIKEMKHFNDFMAIVTGIANNAIPKLQTTETEIPEATEATDPATPPQLEVPVSIESLHPPSTSEVCPEVNVKKQDLPSHEFVKPVQPPRCATEFPHTCSPATSQAILEHHVGPPIVLSPRSPNFCHLAAPVAVSTTILADGIGDEFQNQPVYPPSPKRLRLQTPVRAIAAEIASSGDSFMLPTSSFLPPSLSPSFLVPTAPTFQPSTSEPAKQLPSKPQPVFPEECIPFSPSSRRSGHTPRQCVGTSPDTSNSHLHSGTVTKEHPPNSPRTTNSSSSGTPAQTVRSSPRLVNRSSASTTTTTTTSSTSTPHMPILSHTSHTPPSPNKRAKSSTPTPPRPTSRASSSPGSPSSLSASPSYTISSNGSPILIDNPSNTILFSPNKSLKRKSHTKFPLSPDQPFPEGIESLDSTDSIDSIESIESMVPSHILNSHKRKPKYLHKRYLSKLNPSLSQKRKPIPSIPTTSIPPPTSAPPSQTRIPTRLSQKLAFLAKNRRPSRTTSTSSTPTLTMVTRSASAGGAHSTRLSQRIAEIQQTRSPTKSPKKSPTTTPVKQTATSSASTTTPKVALTDSANKRPPPCSCHQCKSQKTQVVTCKCLKKFCNACLRIHYDEDWIIAKKDPTWLCPFCRDICTCKACRVKKNPHEAAVVRPPKKKPPPPTIIRHTPRHAPATRIVARYAQRIHTHAKRAATLRKPTPTPAPVFVTPTSLPTASASTHHASTARKKQKLTVDAYDLDRFVASSPIPIGAGDTKIAERIKRDLFTPGWIVLYDDDDGYPDLTRDLVCGNWREDWEEPHADGEVNGEGEGECEGEGGEKREKQKERDAVTEEDQEMSIPGLQSVLDRRERALRRSLRMKEEEEKEKEKERAKAREQNGGDNEPEEERLKREEKEKEKEKAKELQWAKQREKEQEKEKEKEKEREKAKEKLRERERIKEEKAKEKEREKQKEREKEKERLKMKIEEVDDESDEDTSDEAYVNRHRGMRELIVRAQPHAHQFKDSELLLLSRKPLILPTPTIKPTLEPNENPLTTKTTFSAVPPPPRPKEKKKKNLVKLHD